MTATATSSSRSVDAGQHVGQITRQHRHAGHHVAPAAVELELGHRHRARASAPPPAARCASDSPAFNRTEISAESADGNRYANRALGTRAPRAGSNTSW